MSEQTYAEAKQKVNLWKVADNLAYLLRKLHELDKESDILDADEVAVICDLIAEMRPVLDMYIENKKGCGYRHLGHSYQEAIEYFESIEVE